MGISKGIENRNIWAQERGFENYLDYLERLCKEKGYSDINEYNKVKYWNRGAHEPMEFNDECSYFLGVVNAERDVAKDILPIKIGKIIFESPVNFPGYDFICKNEFLFDYDKEEIKIDIKSSCLYDNNRKWCFKVLYNKVPDYFLNIAFDDRNKLNILYKWLIQRDEILRGKPYYRRDKIYLQIWRNICFHLRDMRFK